MPRRAGKVGRKCPNKAEGFGRGIKKGVEMVEAFFPILRINPNECMKSERRKS